MVVYFSYQLFPADMGVLNHYNETSVQVLLGKIHSKFTKIAVELTTDRFGNNKIPTLKTPAQIMNSCIDYCNASRPR